MLNVFLAILVFSSLLQIPSDTVSQPFLVSSPYVYRIEISSCDYRHPPIVRQQTGFRLKGKTGIYTALHGVADCSRFTAFPDDRGIPPIVDLRLAKVDIDHDVALLTSNELEGAGTQDGLEIAPNQIPRTGLQVLGYPLGLVKQKPIGIVTFLRVTKLTDLIPPESQSRELKQRHSPDLTIDVYDLEANVAPGHSGAPLLNPEGKVAGIINGGLRRGDIPYAWAIQLQTVDLQDVKLKQARFDFLKQQNPKLSLGFSVTFLNSETEAIAPKNISKEALSSYSAEFEISRIGQEGGKKIDDNLFLSLASDDKADRQSLLLSGSQLSSIPNWPSHLEKLGYFAWGSDIYIELQIRNGNSICVKNPKGTNGTNELSLDFNEFSKILQNPVPIQDYVQATFIEEEEVNGIKTNLYKLDPDANMPTILGSQQDGSKIGTAYVWLTNSDYFLVKVALETYSNDTNNPKLNQFKGTTISQFDLIDTGSAVDIQLPDACLFPKSGISLEEALLPLAQTSSVTAIPSLQPSSTSLPVSTVTSRSAPTLTPLPPPSATPLLSATSTSTSSSRGLSKTSELIYHTSAVELEHVADKVSYRSAGNGVVLSDFLARAKFTNPYDSSIAKWDYGFFFRLTNEQGHYRVVVTSDRSWSLQYANVLNGKLSSNEILSGTILSLDISAAGSNFLEIIAQGSRGFFFVNGKLITALDLGTLKSAGQVWVTTGNNQGFIDIGKYTHVDDFAVWSLVPQPIATSKGKLMHDPLDNKLSFYEPGLKLRNFLATVQFKNPYEIDKGPWDYGVVLRSDKNKSGAYRVVIKSDSSWNIFIAEDNGSIRSTANFSGPVNNLSVGEGASNELLMIVFNNQLWVSLNNQFLAKVDISEINTEGDIQVATGLFRGNELAGESTQFESFNVWGLPSEIQGDLLRSGTQNLDTFVSKTAVSLNGKAGTEVLAGELRVEITQDKKNRLFKDDRSGNLTSLFYSTAQSTGIYQIGRIQSRDNVYSYVVGDRPTCTQTRSSDASVFDIPLVTILMGNVVSETKQPLGAFLGEELKNGVQTYHYSLKSDALDLRVIDSERYTNAQVWLRVSDGLLVRLIAEADAEQIKLPNGNLFSGKVLLSYDLTKINSDVRISLPNVCK